MINVPRGTCKWKVILNIQILMILIHNEYLYQNEKKIEIWYISERGKISEKE